MQKDLLTEPCGKGIQVTLNRPEALNALSLPMIQGIRRVLAETRDDDGVEFIVFRGAGDRAFCSGGDVKAVYLAGLEKRDTTLAKEYFSEEYSMNRELFHYPKPLIAVMNGITMGGGFGVAGPCRVRIATEKTVFAMPEVGIGLFPDVGSMYFLTRLPRRIGLWLALTGERLDGQEMAAVGLATHFMKSGEIVDFADPGLPPSPGPRWTGRRGDEDVAEIIENYFSFSEVEEILENLDQDKSLFARRSAEVIRTKSPTSLKLTCAYYHKMIGKDFDAVTDMDYRLAIGCMEGHEFYEGIRAALIDKDRNPLWQPERLNDVRDDVIESYFDTARSGLGQTRG